jgi:hypothetical protein
MWGQHISIFGICEDVRHFSQHSYTVTINSHNGRLTLLTDSHAGWKDNIERQIQTTIQWNSSISETVRNRKHVHIQFLFRIADTVTSQNIDLSSWDILYKIWLTRILIWPTSLLRTLVVWCTSLFADHKIDLLMKCEFFLIAAMLYPKSARITSPFVVTALVIFYCYFWIFPYYTTIVYIL